MISAMSSAILHELNNQVFHDLELLLRRPTVVPIVRDETGLILSVRSANGHNWGPVQGGVEKSDVDIIHAILRELNEEVGIEPHDVSIASYCGTSLSDNPSGSRGVFPLGKKYYYFLVRYYGKSELRIRRTEVSDYRWHSRREWVDAIRNWNPEFRQKREELLAAFARIT